MACNFNLQSTHFLKTSLLLVYLRITLPWSMALDQNPCLQGLNSLFKPEFQAEKITQLVKCLLCKLENMNLIPRIHIKNWVSWNKPLIPALKKQRQAVPWGSLASQPIILGKLQASERFGLLVKNKTLEIKYNNNKLMNK